MRSASLPAVALFLTLAALAACATSTDAPFDPDAGGVKDAGKDAAKPDSGVAVDAGPVCADTCASDLDCQNTCPAVVNNGVNCCDLGTFKCFPVADSICPAPVEQDSGPPPAY